MLLLGGVAKARGDRIVVPAQMSARALQQGHTGWIGHEEGSLKPADDEFAAQVRESQIAGSDALALCQLTEIRSA